MLWTIPRRLARALRGLAGVMRVNWANLVAWWQDDVIYDGVARKKEYIVYLVHALRSDALPTVKR